jgi:hypothetical protein
MNFLIPDIFIKYLIKDFNIILNKEIKISDNIFDTLEEKQYIDNLIEKIRKLKELNKKNEEIRKKQKFIQKLELINKQIY